MEILNQLFSSGSYIPHGHCYLWQSPLVWLHILSDGFTTLAYYSIPLMLVYFIRQREDVPFRSIFWLFSAFILTCGTTHVMEIWTLWHPTYWLSGSLKALTALVSCYTAIELVPVIPVALSMPSAEDLRVANIALTTEIEERKRIETKLQYRLNFDRLVAELSTQFINLDADALSGGIDQALEELAIFMQAEHSYLFRASPEQKTFSLAHQWSASDFLPPADVIDVPYAMFPWGTAQLTQGHVINVPNVAKLPPEAAQDQAHWTSRQIQAVLCVPLSIEDKFMGWMGFASYTREHNWSNESIQLLTIFAQMLAHTLNRQEVEAARATAQKQLETVFSETPSLTAIADFNGYFQLLSPRFSELLGYSQTELLSQPFLNFVHPDDHASTTTEVAQLTAGNNVIGFENRYRCRDGSYRWLAWFASALPEEQTIYATAVDITERKLEQFALTQQNQGLQLLSNLTLNIRQSREIDAVLQQTTEGLQVFLETDRVSILEITSEGCIVRAEAVLPGHSHIIGEQFLDPCFATDYTDRYRDGQPSMMVDVSQADIQDCHRDLLNRLNVKANLIAPIMNQEQVWGLLVAHQCDHPRQWKTLEIDLLKQVADQISVGLSQWQFLTQLEVLVRDRSTALVTSQKQFRSLFEAAPDLIYMLDTDGIIQRVNPAVTDNLGFEESELIHHPLPEFLTSDCQTTYLQEFEPLLSTGFHRQEMQLRCKNGAVVTMDSSCTVVDPDQDPYILVLQRDISEQKLIESMKDEFVSVVSHELRTPLTSIHGSITLLSSGKLGDFSEQAQVLLNIALRNTDRLNRLINDVLDLERITSGKVVMAKQRCCVSELLTQATQEMQSMAVSEKITLIMNPLNQEIYADPDHIMQALTNLLSNAIKFSSPQETIWLTATMQENNVLFEVKDQGRGIPHDKIEQIFERFQQVDASDARQKGGTGLGLPICRQIIERHGGKIWAESVEGQGSSLYFTLPTFASVHPNSVV